MTFRSMIYDLVVGMSIIMIILCLWWVPFAIPLWINDYYNEDTNAMYAPLEYEYCHCVNFTVVNNIMK